MKLEDRFWEIDFIRGLAIILVVVFHFFYVLRYFDIYTLRGGPLFWGLLPRVLGSTFVTLVGISSVLSYTRAKKKTEAANLGLKYVKRGLKIFSLGLVASLASWIVVGDKFIVFGILHLIGVSIILAYPILRYNVVPKFTLWLSLASLLAGIFMKILSLNSFWLLWLGLSPSGFKAIDYYPLFPWFGFVLLGIFLGNKLYHGYKRNFTSSSRFQSYDLSLLQKQICWLGRNTLKIYLAHVPLILIALYLFINWL